MQVVPLQAIPNQTLQVQLNNQACTISVAQYAFGLFLSLMIGNTVIISGVLCLDRVKIVRDVYLGFSGDLAFIDTKGTSNPDYTGLGDATARYQLTYFLPSEVNDR